MAYVVQGLQLIKQTKNMACWYASAQMVIQWRRNRFQACEMGILDPSEDSQMVALWAANNGITDVQVMALAKAIGLREVPPVSPSADAIEGWLQEYGPLWVNGRSHIVVIGGVSGDWVKVYDPWPTVHPNPQWRSLEWLGGASVDSLDPNASQAVFLHCPQ